MVRDPLRRCLVVVEGLGGEGFVEFGREVGIEAGGGEPGHGEEVEGAAGGAGGGWGRAGGFDGRWAGGVDAGHAEGDACF